MLLLGETPAEKNHVGTDAEEHDMQDARPVPTLITCNCWAAWVELCGNCENFVVAPPCSNYKKPWEKKKLRRQWKPLPTLIKEKEPL
jgi:hypothetical protein